MGKTKALFSILYKQIVAKFVTFFYSLHNLQSSDIGNDVMFVAKHNKTSNNWDILRKTRSGQKKTRKKH